MNENITTENIMRKALNDFDWDEEFRIFIHPSYDGFSYSDGTEQENIIFDALKTTDDINSDSYGLENKITNWASEYHFSRERNNLLRHIDINEKNSVLELGAGCGTITRQLGETGATITAIEGSKTRARIARERCRDLSNVSIYCSNFNDVTLEKKYDVVTLIGVLEYSPMFIKDHHEPIVGALIFAKNALKEGGRLIIAIENQLGLKYFSGATEDHLCEHYVGIEDRYKPEGVKTLGRDELRNNLYCAGLKDIEFQYPFPDYKLPTTIIFERAFKQKNFLVSEIIRHSYARDYANKNTDTIDTSLVWPVLERNNLIAALSNSFLVIAYEADKKIDKNDIQPLAIKYTTNRAQEYNTKTEFLRKSEYHIEVSKSLITNQIQPQHPRLHHIIGQDNYTCGITLHSKILNDVKSNNLSGVGHSLNQWKEFLIKRSGIAGDGSWNSVMAEDCIDCLPFNLIVDEKNLHYIDIEWKYPQKFNLGSLILRYLISIDCLPQTCTLFGIPSGHQRTRIETLRLLIRQMGLTPSSSSYEDFIKLYNDINAVVYPNNTGLSYENLQSMLNNYHTRNSNLSLAPYDKKTSAIQSIKEKYRAVTPWPIQRFLHKLSDILPSSPPQR